MQKSIGIDVSKRSLDVAEYDESGSIVKSYESNTEKTVDKIIEDFSMNPESHKVVMEITGIYHLTIFYRFHELGFSVSTVNPLKIKRYGQMKMLKVKTDKADAFLIAEFGSKVNPPVNTPPKRYQEQVLQLIKCIEDYQEMRTSVIRRIESLVSRPNVVGSVLNSLKKTKSSYEQEIKKLENEVAALIKKYAPVTNENLQSIMGVGKRLSSTVIAMFGNFEEFANAKKLCSYAGICPSPKQSGTSLNHGGSISKQGSSYLRKVLFMASLMASKHNKQCHDLYKRLLAKGKSKKSALIAVANKLLRQIFAVAKYGIKYDPEFGNAVLSS